MNIAGPEAGSILANFGADVIKVEAPAGDRARALEPSVGGMGTLFAAMNQNKRYLGLDLTRPAGREVIGRLIDSADVLIQNFRAGKDADLGVGAEQCHARNARLVHCSVEAFYPDEPARPGFDLLVQAESGILGLTGDGSGGPCRLPGPIIDQVTALWVATAASTALHGPRDRPRVSVSMIDVAVWLLADKVSAYLATGDEPGRLGSQTSATTPHGAYRTMDGWLVIGAATDVMFGRLARALGPPLDDDDRFATQAGRLTHRSEVTAAIESCLAGRTTEDSFELLTAADVPVARVLALPDAVERHRDASRTGVTDASMGPVTVAPPVSLDGQPFRLDRAPGAVGRDSAVVLAECGFSDAEIDRLVTEGVVVT